MDGHHHALSCSGLLASFIARPSAFLFIPLPRIVPRLPTQVNTKRKVLSLASLPQEKTEQAGGI